MAAMIWTYNRGLDSLEKLRDDSQPNHREMETRQRDGPDAFSMRRDDLTGWDSSRRPDRARDYHMLSLPPHHGGINNVLTAYIHLRGFLKRNSNETNWPRF